MNTAQQAQDLQQKLSDLSQQLDNLLEQIKDAQREFAAAIAAAHKENEQRQQEIDAAMRTEVDRMDEDTLSLIEDFHIEE